MAAKKLQMNRCYINNLRACYIFQVMKAASVLLSFYLMSVLSSSAFWLSHKSEQTAANIYVCPCWHTICWSRCEPEPQLRTWQQTWSRERNLVKLGVVWGDTGGLCYSHKAALSGLGGLRPVAALAQTPVLTPPGAQRLMQWALNGLEAELPTLLAEKLVE